MEAFKLHFNAAESRNAGGGDRRRGGEVVIEWNRHDGDLLQSGVLCLLKVVGQRTPEAEVV